MIAHFFPIVILFVMLVAMDFSVASDVKLFSASTIDSDVTVVEGDQVAFLCRCEGFPIPSMEIVDLHGVVMKPLVQAVNTELSIERQVNHVVSCYGTGQYLCKCENTHSVSNSTLNVTVNCKFQLFSLSFFQY